jgi:hypothetical protein
MKKTILLILLLSITVAKAQHTITLSPVQDAYIKANGGGEGKNTFFKFNIQSLPTGVVIIDTRLTVWVCKVDANWDGDMRYIFFTNQAWTEADSTQDMWINIYYPDTLEQLPFTFGMLVNSFSQSIDLTQFLLYNYLASDSTFSFRMKDPDDGTTFPPMNVPINDNNDSLITGNIFHDYIWFRPREYSNPNQRPYLTIQYGIPPTSGPVMIIPPFCEGMSFLMAGNASGDFPMSYQWLKDGVPLVGQTDSTLAIISANSADSGNYQLISTNNYGSDTSANYHVVVNTNPTPDLGGDVITCQYFNFTFDAGPGYDSYNWNDGSTDQTLSADATIIGFFTYWVIVTKDGCIGADSVILDVESCPGISENNQDVISIFPNPAEDFVNIDLKETSFVELYDMLGRQIFSRILLAGNNRVELNKVINGIYLVRISSEHGISYQKLLIKH